MGSLTGYLDNMAAVAMNSGSAFEQYTANFTNLAKTTPPWPTISTKSKRNLQTFSAMIIPSRKFERSRGTRGE